MMKMYNPFGWAGVRTAILVTLGVLLAPAYCQLPTVLPTMVLLLRQNLVQGGTITPSIGVHDFTMNAEVTLTAIPKPGYYFVCWMGDVADSTSSTTVAILNKPKIIIAMFEQNEYDTSVLGAGAHSSSYSGGGSSGGGYSGGSNYSPSPGYNPPSPPDNPPTNPPVVPTPEPATGLLLALGILALQRKRGA